MWQKIRNWWKNAHREKKPVKTYHELSRYPVEETGIDWTDSIMWVNSEEECGIDTWKWTCSVLYTNPDDIDITEETEEIYCKHCPLYRSCPVHESVDP